MLAFFKNLFKKTDFNGLMNKGAIIIDVRTPVEFDAGHIGTSKNIPLDRLKLKVDELKRYKVPIICCCASGMRSGTATNLLKSNGIEAYNGGSWQSLSNKI